MSNFKRLALLVSVVGMSCCVPAMAQDKKEPAKPAPAAPAPSKDKPAERAPAAAGPDMKAMEEAWEKAAKTGTEHKWIEEHFAGNWDVDLVEYGPAGPGKAEKGKMSSEMKMGGRFLMMEFAGSMQGKGFKGHGMVGYNNASKKFESVWIDSMGTSILSMYGTLDKTGKVLIMSGNIMDPMSGQNMTFKEVLTLDSKDTHSMKFYMSGPGMPGETVVMEQTYTRAGKGSAKKEEMKKDEKKEDKKDEKKTK